MTAASEGVPRRSVVAADGAVGGDAPRIGLAWSARAAPLVARGVVATGLAARGLARRLAGLDESSLAALSALAGLHDELLLVLGEAGALPWADGAIYLGRDDAAPGLLLPTALAPTIAPAALEAAIRVRVPHELVAVLPVPARLVPCGGARPVDRARLVAWLERA